MSPAAPPLAQVPLALPLLHGYSPALLDEVRRRIADGSLAERLHARYPLRHTVRTDAALYDYTQALKAEYLRQSVPLGKVVYDPRMHVVRNALGTHTAVSRVQGSKLKAKREIHIAALFRDTPPEFLRMIVVHELAHLRERDHDKAFYALCEHMEPHYHQYEFDLRLHLTLRELGQQPPVGST